ncbi:MAG: cysteine desulfurase [Acholeplasmataceae bacterium]|nr:cysteine desulfurase [Acholeplasmataceae bacterium]
MVYLDYSATTPCDERVLQVYVDTIRAQFANPNSGHRLGLETRANYLTQTQSIAALLNMEESEVVLTSGATEANNLAIRGVVAEKGAHALTTPYEHPSVIACFSSLQKKGIEVEFVPTDANGVVDIQAMRQLIRENTYLVSIGAVNSEIGIAQDLDAVKDVLTAYPSVLFHSDITQALGKLPLPKRMPDLVSLSAHKIYGLKGSGALLKPKGLRLERILAGGHGLSAFRPGTPDLPQAVMLNKAIALSLALFSERYKYIERLNRELREQVALIIGVHINSPRGSLPHILNLSLPPYESSKLRDYLSLEEIYVSTQTACSGDAPFSEGVLRLTGDPALASSSIRISLSHLTTSREINIFLEALRKLVRQ